MAVVFSLFTPTMSGEVRKVLRPTSDPDEFCHVWIAELKILSKRTAPDDFDGLIRKGMITLYDGLLQSNPVVSGSRAVGYFLKEGLQDVAASATPSDGIMDIYKCPGNGAVIRTSKLTVAVNLSAISFPWVEPETSAINRAMKQIAEYSDILLITDGSSASADKDVVDMYLNASKPVFAPQGVLDDVSGVKHYSQKGERLNLTGNRVVVVKGMPAGEDTGTLVELRAESLMPLVVCTEWDASTVASLKDKVTPGGILITKAWADNFAALTESVSPSSVISVGEHSLDVPYAERGFMNASAKALKSCKASGKVLMIPGESWRMESQSSGIEPTIYDDGAVQPRYYDMNGVEIRCPESFHGIYVEKKGNASRKLIRR